MARVIETTVYKLDEHPNPEKVFEWVRGNWHNLGEWSVQEVVDSLIAFAEHVGAKADWALSIVPDRGEFVRFDFGYDEPSLGKMMLGVDLSGNCPFTGTWADEIILDAFREAAKDANATKQSVLHDVEFNVLKVLHAEGEYIYSDDGLREMIEANEYEFTAEGECI